MCETETIPEVGCWREAVFSCRELKHPKEGLELGSAQSRLGRD